MPAQIQEFATELIRGAAHPLSGSAEDFAPLMQLVGDATVVLIGEASHGTHEFYRIRAEITKHLIREKGFTAVTLEADWPDTARANRYVQGTGNDLDASDALAGFQRFPSWMWRNADFLDFVGWLRAHNDSVTGGAEVGIYGLDLYSLHASMAAVLAYLEKMDADGARRARARYACFDQFGGDPQAYGYAAGIGLSHTCEREVIAQLVDLHTRAAEYMRRDGRIAADDFFSAEQNARIVRNAEEYYRSMFFGNVLSWNLRDSHMAETLQNLIQHLEHGQPKVKVVVWAHNSHIGDARATQMGRTGEWNIGQLARESYGNHCRSIGFTTYTGTVTAASEWDTPAEVKKVQPGRQGSYEELFHRTGLPSFLLALDQKSEIAKLLKGPMLERAIGVIYKPETELQSHYFLASIPHQFDAVLHYDHTRAVEPLETKPAIFDNEPEETFPSGI